MTGHFLECIFHLKFFRLFQVHLFSGKFKLGLRVDHFEDCTGTSPPEMMTHHLNCRGLGMGARLDEIV